MANEDDRGPNIFQENPETVPIHALFDARTIGPEFKQGIHPNLETDYRPDLEAAELIFGVDVMSGNQFIVWGRKLLQDISSGREPARQVKTFWVSLDQAGDELEQLIALVKVFKGSHDYQAYKPPTE